MPGETILVIDAGEEIDQKITTALESKGYLVFTASSQVLNAETLEKLSPSLIYMKPLVEGSAGVEPCKAIHGDPILKGVPIVLLESPDGFPDLDILKGYGVVDVLNLTLGPDELIKKTETILGKASSSQLHKGNGWGLTEPVSPPRPTPHTRAAEDDPQVNEWESIDRALSEKHRRTEVKKPWNDVEEDQGEGTEDESPWSETVRGKEKKRLVLRRPVILAAIFVGVAGAGLLAYQQFAPTRKVWSVRPVTAPSPASPKPRDTRPEPQVSPEKKVTDKPGPLSAVPTSQVSPTQAPPSQAPPSQAPVLPSPVPQSPASPSPASKASVTPAPSPAPAQVPSSLPPSAPLAPPKPFYSVQIGAFKNEATAQDLAEKFVGKGYDAFTQRGVTKDKSPIYRVLVSKVEDRKEARKLAEEIRSKEKMETAVYGD